MVLLSTTFRNLTHSTSSNFATKEKQLNNHAHCLFVTKTQPMKHLLSFLIFSFAFLIHTSLSAQWKPDVLGEDFEQLAIQMPDDYEGAVQCVLVKHLSENPSTKAVFYIHGFNDYYFQEEQAYEYSKHGYTFYAIDLRKYGRAYLPHQKMGNIRSLKEYFPDIDTCLSIIKQEGFNEIILSGHSTGGLIACVYAQYHKENLSINGMVLNSPFLDMNFGKLTERAGVPVVSFLGGIFPNIKLSSGSDSFYAQSLHQNYSGEWDYNLDWKSAVSIPVSFGWTRAIHKGHKKVRKGMDIPCPILVLHSDKSVYGNEFNNDFMNGDAVLNIDDIHKYAQRLGKDVTIVTINNGLHDLILSKKEVRNETYETIFSWLDKHVKEQGER